MCPGLQPTSQSRCFRWFPLHCRDFSRMLVFTWVGSKWPLGFDTLRVEMARVPLQVIGTSVANQVGDAYISRRQADGVAVWLVQHALNAGLMRADISPAIGAAFRQLSVQPTVPSIFAWPCVPPCLFRCRSLLLISMSHPSAEALDLIRSPGRSAHCGNAGGELVEDDCATPQPGFCFYV